VLAARGLSDASAARTFLGSTLSDLPDPLLIPGMSDAVKRLVRAAETGELLWIYTDFDADGVTSAALLSTFFHSAGIACRTWLPRRDREGYGLHTEPLEAIAREGGGCVVTADCGITAIEPALVARRLGLGLVITDHHTPGDVLPDADAVVNPKIGGNTYPDSMIAGVGVAWNLVAALRRELRERNWFSDGRTEPDLKEFLDLVALGTVADVVPLRNVNRIFVRSGLMSMNREPRPGIQALAEAAGLRGEIRAGHLSFQLGPRINAAGRMEGPNEAVDLLVSGGMSEARALASRLDKLNRERREEEASTLASALHTVERQGRYPGCRSLVVEGAGYHPGVVGIVASRLVERFYRPTVVLAVNGDQARGSARSIQGLDLHDALRACERLLIRFGGHRAAAGLTLATSNIPAFREAFEEAVSARLGTEDYVPLVEADAEPPIEEFTAQAVGDISRLEPFGYGNPTPLFMFRGLTVRDRGQLGGDGGHIRLRLEKGPVEVEAVGWHMADRLAFASPGTRLDLMATVRLRDWKGVSRVQLALEDVRRAESGLE
jgi:single-stranded-DNA-specific exonuclease